MTRPELLDQLKIHEVSGKGPGWDSVDEIADRIMGMVSTPPSPSLLSTAANKVKAAEADRSVPARKGRK